MCPLKPDAKVKDWAKQHIHTRQSYRLSRKYEKLENIDESEDRLQALSNACMKYFEEDMKKRKKCRKNNWEKNKIDVLPPQIEIGNGSHRKMNSIDLSKEVYNPHAIPQTEGILSLYIYIYISLRFYYK